MDFVYNTLIRQSIQEIRMNRTIFLIAFVSFLYANDNLFNAADYK